MKFVSLGSGSKGNCSIIQSANSTIMVDCGFSGKEAVKRLSAKGLSPSELDAIFVTHEHTDHAKGVLVLAKKYQIALYMTAGTAKALSLAGYQYNKLVFEQEVVINDVTVHSVAVPHDSNEASQFVFESNQFKIGVLTDLGHVTPHILEYYRQCDALLVEFNHDVTLLANGPYPPSLKLRVGGMYGHLNNQQAADLLRAVDLEKLQTVAVSHISEKNNDISMAQAMVHDIVDPYKIEVHILNQLTGCQWITLN